MNSRERVMTALACGKPDRVPYFDYLLLPPLASQILNRPFIDFGGDPAGWMKFAGEVGWEKAVKSYARDRVELSVKLGHDLIYSVPCPVPSKPGPKREKIDDPAESMKRRVEEAEAREGGLPAEAFLVYDYLLEEMEMQGVELPILAPACGHGIWTDTELMMAMVTEPELAHRHFEAVTKSTRYDLEQYAARKIPMIMVGGDFAGNRPLISPGMYREFIMPEVRKTVDTVHGFGACAVNASDGDLWGVIDDFLTGCDVDGYNEIDFSCGMDLGALHERFGKRVCLFGNMDCGNTLSFASPEKIAEETRACLASCGGFGHIFSASNAISASVPMENYLAMQNAYREFYALPKLER